ncbi:MAG: hypothetical protein QW314_07720 [Thermoproteota archaeon]|nr:hypothetical protein [Candidatus Brockarchaeota archaeon]
MLKKSTSKFVFEFTKNHFEIFSLLFLFLYTFLSVKTIFLKGMIPGWDNPVHYVNAYLTALYMFPKLNILEWDPFNEFGWVFNLYYNPGMSVFVSFIYYLFFRSIDFLLAYKIAFFLAYFLLAPAVYMFVHALTEDKIAAIVSSLLSITTFVEESTWFDAGLKQMYYIGMWPERLGMVFAFFSVAFLAYSFASKSLPKVLLLTGMSALMFFMAVLTHVMMGISAAYMATLLWFFLSIKLLKEVFSIKQKGLLKNFIVLETPPLLKFASAGFLSLGMAAFWMLPLFQTLSTYHSFPAITWSTGPSIFGEIFTSFPWYLLIFYCIGAFSYVFVQGKISYPSITSSTVILFLQVITLASLNDGYVGLRLIIAVIVSLILLLSSDDLFVSFSLALISLLGFLATGPDTYVVFLGPIQLNLLNILPFARNFGYSKFSAPARILVLSLSALGFSRLSRKLYSLSKASSFSVVYSVVVGLLAFLIINSSLNAQLQTTDLLYPWNKEKVFKLTSDYPGFNKVDDLINWTKLNVPNNTYILFQDTLDLGDNVNFQTSHYIYVATITLDRPSIGGCFGTNYITNPYANSEGGYLLGFEINKFIEDKNLLLNLMNELGISYVAIFDSNLINVLNTSNDFRLEYYNGLYAVFRKVNLSDIVFIEGQGKVDFVNFSIDHIKIKVSQVLSNDSYLIIRQVNFPGFMAEVNGKPVPISTYYPKLPNAIINWHWVQPVYNWRIPFIKIKLPINSSEVMLDFEISTPGTNISRISWVILIIIFASAIVLLLVRRFVKK